MVDGTPPMLGNSHEEHYKAATSHLSDAKKNLDAAHEHLKGAQTRLDMLTGKTPTTIGSPAEKPVHNASGAAPLGISPLGGQAKY